MPVNQKLDATPEQRRREFLRRAVLMGAKWNDRRKVYQIRYPKRLEMEYARKIGAKVATAYDKALGIILDELPNIIRMYRAEYRLDTASADALNRAIDTAEAAIEENLSRAAVSQTATVYAQRVGEYNHNEMNRQWISKLGVAPIMAEPWLRPKMEDWVENNTDLITNIKAKTLNDVRQIVRNGIDEGRLQRDMAKDITAAMETTKARGILIARDQVGKMFGSMTKARNEDAGLTHFVWVDAGDSRVRPEHRRLNGNTYSWALGADGLYPGMAVQCRCVASGVMNEMKEDLDAESPQTLRFGLL